ncbi:MAG: GNAT family N-acetyltransferase [Bullifex sp.]
MTIRFAEEKDLGKVNELRRQVNDLHTEGRPDIFRPGFPDELRACIKGKTVIVAESGDAVVGFAVITPAHRKETPFQYARDFLEIDELGVDSARKRKGVATEILKFIESYAKENGISGIELNMWEFNQEALAFYEASGFRTYRRYLEKSI